MVAVLIAMKLTALRHAMTDQRAATMVSGGVAGLALAAATILLAAQTFGHPSALGDLLALAFAAWLVGWVVGPVMVGGQPVLRPEHFALLPVARGRLALGLLASACVGVTAGVMLIAFAALLVYGARLGPAAAAVCAPAVVLQLSLVVLASQVGVRLLGALMGSRAGGVLAGVLTGGMLVLATSGWIVLIAIEEVGRTGFSATTSEVVRALPTSWGIAAADAADRGDGLHAAAALAGLAALVAVLLAVWGRLLDAPPAARAVVRGARRGGPPRWTSQTAAVATKELRTWARDPGRVGLLVLAPAWALLTCLVPLAFDSEVLLPWTGAACAAMAAATSANLIGQDGTALWSTLLTPDGERHDVRGRQLAWLAVFTPASVALGVGGAVAAGDAGAWPWTLALLPALLGGGAGLIALAGVLLLAPGPDPRRRTSPLDHADTTAQGFAVLAALAALAGPTVAVLLLVDGPLRWAAVAVGVGSGALSTVWLGGVAAARLRVGGPELLALMRSGAPAAVADTSAHAAGGRRWTVLVAIWLGLLALFPQALVPLAIVLADGDSRVWFLALYLPTPWREITIATMLTIGVALLGVAAVLSQGARHEGVS